jgi:hypothetical protein
MATTARPGPFATKATPGTRFGGWLVFGAVIYALFGYRNSRLRREA